MDDDENLSHDEVPMVDLEDGDDSEDDEMGPVGVGVSGAALPVAGSTLPAAAGAGAAAAEPAPAEPVQTQQAQAQAARSPRVKTPIETIERDRGHGGRRHTRPRMKSAGPGIGGGLNRNGRPSVLEMPGRQQSHGSRRQMQANRAYMWSRYPGSPSQFKHEGGMLTAPGQLMGAPYEEFEGPQPLFEQEEEDSEAAGTGQGLNGTPDAKKKQKDKKKAAAKPLTLGQRINNSSLAIYIAIILFGYFVAKQGEALEANLGQVVTALFNFFSIGSIVASVIAGLVLLYRGLRVSGLFSRKPAVEEVQRIPDPAANGAQGQEYRVPRPLDGYWSEEHEPAWGGEFRQHAFGPGWHDGPGLSRRGSQRASAQRSYSQPAIQVPTPVYGFEREMSPGTGPGGPGLSPQAYGPANPWDMPPHQRSSRGGGGRKIPIVSVHDSPLPQQPGTGYAIFPDPYKPYEAYYPPAPAVPAASAPKVEKTNGGKDSFTSPVKVVFRRRESEGDAPALHAPPSPYVDDFSCKPYGAPPRRFRGIVN